MSERYPERVDLKLLEGQKARWQAAADADPDPFVRGNLSEWIRRIGDREAAKVLRKAKGARDV